MALNKLVSGIPNAVSITPLSGSAISLDDIISFSITETGNNFINQAGDKAMPMDGGNINCDFSAELSFLDSDDFKTNYASLQAGDEVTAISATYTGRGAQTQTLTIAISGTSVINSLTSADNNGRKQWNINFDIFSSDGSTYPVTQATA